MILPGVSMLCQYPAAGPTMARQDSAQARVVGIVVKAVTIATPPSQAIITGVVVGLATANEGRISGISQGNSSLALRITNQSNKQTSAAGSPLKHEHISYP